MDGTRTSRRPCGNKNINYLTSSLAAHVSQGDVLVSAGLMVQTKADSFDSRLCAALFIPLFWPEISVGAKIGGGLYIAHPIGTVIAAEEIGENCSIIASVTIGMRNKWAFPRIGNNVFIGAGARVLGEIKVGDNAIIGANAVVISDVPAGATAVGIPAKVVRLANKNESEMNQST